jgi:glutathione S-transferase
MPPYADGLPLGVACATASQAPPRGTVRRRAPPRRSYDGRQLDVSRLRATLRACTPTGGPHPRLSPSTPTVADTPRATWLLPRPTFPEELRRGAPSAYRTPRARRWYAEGRRPSAYVEIPVVYQREQQILLSCASGCCGQSSVN